MTLFDEAYIELPDGYKTYSRYWQPLQSQPRIQRAVLYLPGIQSHCGWFEQSARTLAESGCAVLQVDRRGCGHNQKQRGHAESADQLIADAVTAADYLLGRTQLGAYHIVGVSWGGKLAIATYLKEPQRVDSLALVAPGLFPRMVASKEEQSEIGFAMLYEPEKRYDIPLNDAELLTSDPKWQTFINDDPLALRQCTAGFYLASRRMDRMIKKLGEASPVPIRLFFADDEHIIDNQATEKFFHDLGWDSCIITQYTNARHNLEFERDASTFIDDLTDFILSV